MLNRRMVHPKQKAVKQNPGLGIASHRDTRHHGQKVLIGHEDYLSREKSPRPLLGAEGSGWGQLPAGYGPVGIVHIVVDVDVGLGFRILAAEGVELEGAGHPDARHCGQKMRALHVIPLRSVTVLATKPDFTVS